VRLARVQIDISAWISVMIREGVSPLVVPPQLAGRAAGAYSPRTCIWRQASRGRKGGRPL